jgi:hypothetical protein
MWLPGGTCRSDGQPVRLVERRRLTRSRIEHTFGTVDRYPELEDLRRSLAMLPPGSAGLSREDAMALASELQEQIARVRRLRDRLGAVLAQDD